MLDEEQITTSLDWAQVAQQLLRALRGERAQKEWNALLGYQSNVASAWERGKDFPTASRFFQVLELVGHDTSALVERFGRGSIEPPLTSRAGVTAFLASLRGDATILEIAERTARDRFAVGRFLKGTSEPRLPDLLALVDAMTLGALDFLALFVDPKGLVATRERYTLLEDGRRLLQEFNWSQAVLVLVATPAYSCLAQHEEGWFASRLGISIEEERACLGALLGVGRLRFEGGKFAPGPVLSLDTRHDARRTKEIGAFWARHAAAHLEGQREAFAGFNVFGVSHEGHAHLKKLSLRYFEDFRRIVAESEPTEVVAVLNFQIVPLGP